jgi:hypothetical protein
MPIKIAEMELTVEIRWAIMELATSLARSDNQTLLVRMRSRGTQASYVDESLGSLIS